MEWLNKMNSAIDYIEAFITEKVDYVQAANIACCSLSRFQNMFLFITDITLSEYVRRRRMALAANELINDNVKIVDLAFKYGYESPAAFTRSFKAFHGLSPSVARKFKKYIDYPRISFQMKIIGGHFTMETIAQFEVYKNILIKVEIIELPETLKFAGLTCEGLQLFQNIGVYQKEYKPLMIDRYTPYTEIGICSNISSSGFYIFGCQVDSIDDLPDGLIGLDTGLKRFACLTFRVQPGGDLVGGSPDNGMSIASEYLENEWIPKNKDTMYNFQYTNQKHPPYRFEIKKEEKNYRLTNIPTEGLEKSYRLSGVEVYKVNIQDDPEMCYYIPLK